LGFFLFLPFPLLIASTPIVIIGGSSTMILKLGMGRMGLCLVFPRRHNSRAREDVTMKDCRLGRHMLYGLE
jgi:hypothetical protein